MNIRERIVIIMMMMSVHVILVPATVSASRAKIGKNGITDETRDKVRKLHEKAKDAKWEMLDAKHRGTSDIQNSFAREVVNPVIKKSNGEAGEDRLLQQVTAPVFCGDSDPEFDGVVCLIPNYPNSEFTTGLVGCPLNTESTREFFQCKDGCLVFAGDLENENFCASCTLCSNNDIGFGCNNIASGDCAAYDCRTGSCGGSTGNPPPPPQTSPTRSPTLFPTPFPTPFPNPTPVFNPPPPPPPNPRPTNPSPFGNPPFEQIENNPTPSNTNPAKPFGGPPFSGAPTCRLYSPISLSLLGATVTLMMLRL